ncbi:MAG: glutathione S-transferase family protein [Hyphomicrobiales bacterium]
MLNLYYAKGTAALAPHIILEEIGKEYEATFVDFTKAEQTSPEFLKLNPKGRVPALITQNGILTETPTILTYLSNTNPELSLAPTDPFEFAVAQSFNDYVNSTIHVMHAHGKRGSRWADDTSAHESMQAKLTENMTECARMIETHYLTGPFVLGEKFSICDPYLYLVTRWLTDDGVTLDVYPNISQHRDLMNKRASVAKVIKLHD